MSDGPSIAVQALCVDAKKRGKAVFDFQAAAMKMSRAYHAGSRIATIALAIVATAEGFALASLAPLVRVQAVFIPIRDDGSTASPMEAIPSWTVDGLKNSDAVLQSTLWSYVQNREQYNWATAQYSWDVISAMSSVKVRDEFQRYWNADNKNSPQWIYGYKDAVKLDWVESRLEGESYSVTFWRTRWSDGAPVSKPELYVCNLGFSKTYAVPFRQRFQYNPSGLAVTSYPGCNQKGAKPNAIPGSAS